MRGSILKLLYESTKAGSRGGLLFVLLAVFLFGVMYLK
ncbi:hypothetical protein KNP414_00872 [Paenibacillus mucilaginosus KNP414]|uniref:Uncharacterized protein n=1 Tax=Paenibacillus mucilaginosus (strain KNP414) TaxID=1036673 RepID=F8F4S0_PAEMK|nr:hypothetical protein KNP414_00872 [Paenibacillus mucilaginosus KNP414]